MKTLLPRWIRSLAVLGALAGGGVGAAPDPALLVYDFELGMTPAENVEHVRSLGFRGIVTRVRKPADVGKLAAYARHAASIDGFRVLAFVPYDFDDPASPKVWREALPILARVPAPLWVIVRNAPSELALRELLERMARDSWTHGIPTVLYPHWNTSIESAAHASALVRAVGNGNLWSSLHTCHEIRAGNQDALALVAHDHVAETALVTIAGADVDAYSGRPAPGVDWSDAIKPLDRGDFSLLPFLQALHDTGYDGPVILQTFGIVDDPGHLRRSLEAYADYTEQLRRSGVREHR